MRIALLLTFFLCSIMAFAGEKTTETFSLDYQMCRCCEAKIKDKLSKEKGVEEIEVSLKQNLIFITYDKDKTNPEKLIKGFKKIGFNAFIMGCEPTTHEEPHAIEIQ